MAEPLVIRPLEAHEWEKHRDIRLRSLAESPDAFFRTLAQEQERAPDSWATRLSEAAASGDDYPLIAELAGTAVGLLWAQADAADTSVVNIYQVWVAPESRGRGVAAALLQEAIGWARARQARVVRLSVTCGDTSARRLYARAGFQDDGPPVPRHPGLPLHEQNMQLVMNEG